MNTNTNLTVPSNLAPQIVDALDAGFTTADLGNYRTLDAQYGTDTDAHPDFAALFPARECTTPIDEQLEDDFYCENPCCTTVTLTPRQAWTLHWAAVTYLDFMAPLEDPIDSWALEHYLPRVCQPYLADPVWVTQLRHVFHVTAARVASGQIPFPRSTGEEMALHLILGYGADAEADDMLAVFTDYLALPELANDAFSLPEDLGWLFQDEDVLMLFDPALDGIENSDTATRMRTVNLHPSEWFIPFRKKDDVHADLVVPNTPHASA